MLKAWEYIKKYWQILVGFVAAIILVLTFRKKADPNEILENANETHKKEIDAIKNSEEILKNKSEKAEYIYKKALEEIEEKHVKNQEALSSDMRKEVKRIIKDHEEDPGEITRRISELTGFTIHVEDT